MNEPVIAVDMDGVLVDFNPRIMRECEAAGLPYEYEDTTTWRFKDCLGKERADIAWSVINSPDLYDDLEPEPGALDALDALEALGEVIVVTSPTTGHASSKLRWLRRHGIAREDWVLAPSKTRVHWDVLLDDGPHNVEDALDAGRRAVVFDRPWNRDVISAPRAASWEEVPEVVARTLGRRQTALDEGLPSARFYQGTFFKGGSL